MMSSLITFKKTLRYPLVFLHMITPQWNITDKEEKTSKAASQIHFPLLENPLKQIFIIQVNKNTNSNSKVTAKYE